MISTVLFTGVVTLMLSQVIFVFPHINSLFFKGLLAMTCLATLSMFLITQRSHPGHLKKPN